MDTLWAPWRQAYVEKCTKPKKKGCVFCAILKSSEDRKNFIFLRSVHSFAVLNIYPFNGGHVLVIPNRHVADLEALAAEELADLMATVLQAKALMARAFGPDAFNIGMNLGGHAGAGIPDHLHIHIVPRWKGDVNFMPALFGTKVIPVSLDETYKRLKDADKARDRKVRK